MTAEYTLHLGDCLESLRAMPGQSVNCCVTSPPYYGLRNYGVDGQIGLEETPERFIAKLAEVFREVRRVLRDDGTLWLNIGDSYARTGGGDRKVSASAMVGSTRNTMKQMGDRTQRAPVGTKDKDLIGIPWMLAFALRADGWYLRQDIIWHKPNPMPESVRDRCTRAHEYVFLLSKSPRYYYDRKAMQEPAEGSASGAAASFKPSGSKREQIITGQGYGTHRTEREDVAYNRARNRRSVWTVATRPYRGGHFATFPPALIEPCILAGCPIGGVVLDPFGGSGTTAGVALAHDRNAVLCELSAEYANLVPGRVESIISGYGKKPKPKKPKQAQEAPVPCVHTLSLFGGAP